MRIKEQELFEARANLKSKQYKQFVDGAEYISKLFKIKLTPSNAIGSDMGQGVPIYEIDPRDLATFSKYERFEEVNGVEFRTFRENSDGSTLIGVHDGSTLHTAMVADKSTIEKIISNVTWNDMDVQVMMKDFLKSIGIRLGKDDVIYADPKGSKIQINRWGIVQLSKARTGKYGEAEILDIKVDQKFFTARLEVLFDGFETIVDIDNKYRPSVSSKKAKPFVEEILKVVGAKLDNDPVNRHGSVSVLVPRDVLGKLKSLKVYDFINRDMFIVWNQKDTMNGFWDNTQITFIKDDAEGVITFIDAEPETINEAITQRDAVAVIDTLAKLVGVRSNAFSRVTSISHSAVYEVDHRIISKVEKLDYPIRINNNMYYIESAEEVYGGVELVITNGVKTDMVVLTEEPEMFESTKRSTKESTQMLNESYNWNRKFTTIPKHML